MNSTLKYPIIPLVLLIECLDRSCASLKLLPKFYPHLIIFLLFSFDSAGQFPISLNQAIDSAIKNNLIIQNENLKSDLAKVLIKSATVIPSTNITSEMGQINSAYFDTKFGISQNLSFPIVYAKQKQLFTEEWKATLLSASLKKAELKRMVTETFYTYLFWKEKQTLLENLDTIYSALLEKASFRLQKGESNILEKTTFETQQSAISMQLSLVQQEIKVLENNFRLLVNTHISYFPAKVNFKYPELNFENWQNPNQNHPSLLLVRQQVEIAKATTQTEHTKLLPDLILGYTNTSMKGLGADDRLYGASHRFHIAQIGIGIPLFAASQKARIKASIISEQINQKNYEIEKAGLDAKINSVFEQYQRQKNTVRLYEIQYLKNIKIINETAGKQLQNGEINYLELVMLINQASNIQSSYLNDVHLLNQSAIQLEYLLNL